MDTSTDEPFATEFEDSVTARFFNDLHGNFSAPAVAPETNGSSLNGSSSELGFAQLAGPLNGNGSGDFPSLHPSTATPQDMQAECPGFVSNLRLLHVGTPRDTQQCCGPGELHSSDNQHGSMRVTTAGTGPMLLQLPAPPSMAISSSASSEALQMFAKAEAASSMQQQLATAREEDDAEMPPAHPLHAAAGAGAGAGLASAVPLPKAAAAAASRTAVTRLSRRQAGCAAPALFDAAASAAHLPSTSREARRLETSLLPRQTFSQQTKAVGVGDSAGAGAAGAGAGAGGSRSPSSQLARLSLSQVQPALSAQAQGLQGLQSLQSLLGAPGMQPLLKSPPPLPKSLADTAAPSASGAAGGMGTAAASPAAASLLTSGPLASMVGDISAFVAGAGAGAGAGMGPGPAASSAGAAAPAPMFSSQKKSKSGTKGKGLSYTSTELIRSGRALKRQRTETGEPMDSSSDSSDEGGRSAPVDLRGLSPKEAQAVRIAKHNESELRRRTKINKGFEQLALRCCKNRGRKSKATILKHTIRKLDQVTDDNVKLQEELDRLRTALGAGVGALAAASAAAASGAPSPSIPSIMAAGAAAAAAAAGVPCAAGAAAGVEAGMAVAAASRLGRSPSGSSISSSASESGGSGSPSPLEGLAARRRLFAQAGLTGAGAGSAPGAGAGAGAGGAGLALGAPASPPSPEASSSPSSPSPKGSPPPPLHPPSSPSRAPMVDHHALFHRARLPVCVIELGGAILDCTTVFAQLVGIQAPEWAIKAGKPCLGSNVLSLLLPESAEQLSQGLRDLLEGRLYLWRGELRLDTALKQGHHVQEQGQMQSQGQGRALVARFTVWLSTDQVFGPRQQEATGRGQSGSDTEQGQQGQQQAKPTQQAQQQHHPTRPFFTCTLEPMQFIAP